MQPESVSETGSVRQPLAAEARVRLNIGCGSTTPSGWINIDNSPTIWLAQRPALWRLASLVRLIPADMALAPAWAVGVVLADAARRLPFVDESADAAYASHFLEHLTPEQAGGFLREVRRVLRPGGILRIVVPDLGALVERYRIARADGDDLAADQFFENLWVVDKGLARYPAWFRAIKAWLRTDVHRWMYDEASLTARLVEAGFTAIRPCAYLESDIPGLGEVENASRLVDAVCLEARRPAR